MASYPRTILRVSAGAAFASAIFALVGSAFAADKSPPKQPPPIPLNSGQSPQEFPAEVSRVTVEHKADGTRLYHLNGQGMQSVKAQIGPDGKLRFTCTDQAEKAVKRAVEGKSHDH